MGELRDVEEVIKEEVQKRSIQEKREKEMEERSKLKEEDLISYSGELYEENLYLKDKVKDLETKSEASQRILQYVKDLGVVNFIQAGVEWNATTTPSTADVDPQDAYTVFQNSVTVTTRAVNMTRISFKKTGSASNTDLQNFKLYVDGVQVGSTQQLAADNLAQSYVTFDLSGAPKRLEVGTRVVRLVVDIKETARSKNFTFSLESRDDIDLFDSTFYMRIEPTTISRSLFSKRITGIQIVNSRF